MCVLILLQLELSTWYRIWSQRSRTISWINNYCVFIIAWIWQIFIAFIVSRMFNCMFSWKNSIVVHLNVLIKFECKKETNVKKSKRILLSLFFINRFRNVTHLTFRFILEISEKDTENVKKTFCEFFNKQQANMTLYDHAFVYLINKTYSLFFHCLFNYIVSWQQFLCLQNIVEWKHKYSISFDSNKISWTN